MIAFETGQLSALLTWINIMEAEEKVGGASLLFYAEVRPVQFGLRLTHPNIFRFRKQGRPTR